MEVSTKNVFKRMNEIHSLDVSIRLTGGGDVLSYTTANDTNKIFTSHIAR